MQAVEDFTSLLTEARAEGRRADSGALSQPDREQALEIQRRIQAGLGAVGGFKVGAGPDCVLLAPIAQALVVADGAAIPTRDRRGIELEIGFELLRPVEAGMMDRPQDFFVPRLVLEVVDTRLSDAAPSVMAKLADMQLNDGLVVGPALADWDGRDFGTVNGWLRAGETQVIDGAVNVPGGSALANLAMLVDAVGDHCGGLQPGQIVITGSVCGCPWFPAGTDIEGRIEGFGRVTCRFA